MRHDSRSPSWRAFFVGGASGVGKTAVAQAIARRFGVSVVQVDDIRLALQSVTSPEQHPALHYFLADPHVWQRPAETLVHGFIGVGEALMPALAVTIEHHIIVEGSGPVVIEGDALLPRLLATPRLIELARASHGETPVRAVWIHEPEEAVVLRNMVARGRGFQRSSPAEQQTIAHASWLYGEWLRREAEGYGVPVVQSRPWKTLVERVTAAL